MARPRQNEKNEIVFGVQVDGEKEHLVLAHSAAGALAAVRKVKVRRVTAAELLKRRGEKIIDATVDEKPAAEAQAAQGVAAAA
jgi:hypothetical protein